jgi:hypothetical protein
VTDVTIHFKLTAVNAVAYILKTVNEVPYTLEVGD